MISSGNFTDSTVRLRDDQRQLCAPATLLSSNYAAGWGSQSVAVSLGVTLTGGVPLRVPTRTSDERVLASSPPDASGRGDSLQSCGCRHSASLERSVRNHRSAAPKNEAAAPAALCNQLCRMPWAAAALARRRRDRSAEVIGRAPTSGRPIFLRFSLATFVAWVMTFVTWTFVASTAFLARSALAWTEAGGIAEYHLLAPFKEDGHLLV